MNLYVSLRNSSHGLLSANNVLYVLGIGSTNKSDPWWLLVILFGSFVERKSFFKNLFGKEAYFWRTKEADKKGGRTRF